MCRYSILVNSLSGVTSHFYGLPADWAVIAGASLPNFSNEGLDFAVTVLASGACPASAPIPVYRAFRKQTQVDTPNHRYSTSAAAYQDMLVRATEGVVFCAAAATQGIAAGDVCVVVRPRGSLRCTASAPARIPDAPTS